MITPSARRRGYCARVREAHYIFSCCSGVVLADIPDSVFVIPHSIRDPAPFFVIPDYDPGSSAFSRRCAKAQRHGPRVKPGVTVMGARGDISLLSSRTRSGIQLPLLSSRTTIRDPVHTTGICKKQRSILEPGSSPGMTHLGFTSWRQRPPAATVVLQHPGQPHQSGPAAIAAKSAGNAGRQI